MLAVNRHEEEKYGCPNCGCDRKIVDCCYMTNQIGVTCKSCGLHYEIRENGVEPSIKYGTNRKDANGETIMEYSILITHPRKGIPKWHYENPDIRPEYGEYWRSRGIGYDLSGFVKSKPAGERILDMVKEILEIDNPESWLDYRENEPEWIQFKFSKNEFNLEKLDKMSTENNDIITKEILIECKL